jgi:TetR/AcrR family fatty acid metabolism transcriptional regulator
MAIKNPDKYYAILEAALHVFAKHGFHGSQVTKIAKEAGIAGGTVYLYFKNKEEILVHLFQLKLGQLITNVNEATHSSSNAIKALETICRIHLVHSERNPELAYVMQIELRQSNLELRREIGKIVKLYFDLIEQIIVKGMEEGLFRKDLQPKMARSMVFGALDELVTSWVVTGQKHSLSDQVEEASRFLVSALR